MLKTKAFAMEGLNLMDGGEGGIRGVLYKPSIYSLCLILYYFCPTSLPYRFLW